MHIHSEFSVRYGQATEAGLKDRNEDCLGIRIPEGATLATKGVALILADGVSSAEAGREAAEICVQGFLNDYYSTPDTWQVKTAGYRVLVAINRWLYGKGQAFSDACKGYVCAMSAAVLKSRSLHLFHVGDVRIYLLRDGNLEQLTEDHRVRVSPETSYLARAMGLGVNLDIDYRRVPAEPGDVVCLCSDGVYEHIANRELVARVAGAAADLDAACERIVAHALEAGSRDNLSCQLLRIEALPGAGPDEVYEELGRRPFPPPLAPGMRLDGYEVESVLRESPRSQLYRVKDTQTGERWVMKTPSERYSDDPAYIERFLIEEWVGRRLSNPHLVRIVEKRQTPKFLFYLMEYVEGQTLAEWMRANPRPEVGRVVDLIEQIIAGVRALHRKETLHQDLKPENILIDAGGVVRILDFGSVRVAGIHESNVPFERQAELGTRSYSAPEYILQRRPDRCSDFFSIALIAYQLFSGGKGHPYGDKFEQARTVRDFSMLKYIPVMTHNPLIPAWIDGALEKAASLHPDNRYPALSEFVADLKKPNPKFSDARVQPLIERNPLRFWQAVAGILAAVVVLLLVLG